MQFRELALPVENLRLDIRNPRLPDTQVGNDEAIRTMIREQGDKVVNLAEHIVEHGLNPSTLPIVMLGDDDVYTVLDGNRRLTALLLLANPNLGRPILGDKVMRRVSRLAHRFALDPICNLNCVVVDSRDEADTWIMLLHRGQQQGAGVVEWEGQVAARYDSRKQEAASRELQILDFVKVNGTISDRTRDRIARGKFPITSLGRLLATPYVREKLGIALKAADDGTVMLTYPETETLAALSRVVDDLGSGRKTVTDIKSQTQRIEYINSVAETEFSSTFAPLPVPLPLGAKAQQTLLEQQPSSLDIETPVRSRGNSSLRKTLIPTTCRMNIPSGRIQNVFRELKKLNIDDFPNASGILLRAFVEMSVGEYLRTKRHWSSKRLDDAFLSVRLEEVCIGLEQSKRFTRRELEPLRKSASGDTIIVSSIRNLHSLVHNKLSIPKATELRLAWDELQPYLEAMWE